MNNNGYVSVYRYEVDNEAIEIEAAETWVSDCAWCLAESGRPMGNGSHGICERHAAEMVAQARARKQRQAQ